MTLSLRRASRARVARRGPWGAAALLIVLAAGCGSDGGAGQHGRPTATPAQERQAVISSPGAEQSRTRVQVSGGASSAEKQSWQDVAGHACDRSAAWWGVELGNVSVVVTQSAMEYTRLTGRSVRTDGALPAATTVGFGEGERIVIAPGLWDELTATGRDVVLAHECAHLAMNSLGAATPPRWLAEGLAEVTAYDGTGLGPEQIAPDLLQEANGGEGAGGQPRHFPSTADLERDASGTGRAYHEAWTACLWWENNYGAETLRQVFRDVVVGGDIDAAVQRRAGITTVEWRERWGRWLAEGARDDG